MTTTGTSPPGGAVGLPEYADLLEEARERTFALVAPLSAEDLHRQHTPLLSPLVWDLGHIAAFEDLWVCRQTGRDLLRPELADVYDAALTPRAERSTIPFLRDPEVRDYMAAVRERTLACLDEVGAFHLEMLLQHEHQHNETMLQLLKLVVPGGYVPERRSVSAPSGVEGDMVLIEAGPFAMGDAGEGFAYDNERPRHEVHVDAFEIDRLPVTNGDFRAFIEDDGYARPELWSDEGWAWRVREAVERPLYWNEDGTVRDFERVEPPDPDLPVMHVSWYEADAFARWRGARLPTEAEWEKAAAGAGQGNLDHLAFGPAPVGSHPEAASDHGLLGLIGDAWEWTSTHFHGYPGFQAYPYPEYSEVFFGTDYRVLRGGSWATRPRVARLTFRNWDYPQRRQIFAGFRCAKGAT